jgi:hypothetical protein
MLAMTEPTNRPRPATYAKHPPEVWQAIRADYMAGQSVAWCAERHGVGYAIIDWRSRKHGWRTERGAAISARFLAAAETAKQIVAARAAEPAPAQPRTPDEAARAAFAQSAQALTEGRPGEAQTWARLARSMSGMRLPGEGAPDAGDNRDGDPASPDEPWSDPSQRPFRPGIATTWDKLTQIAEKRLDMMFRDFWTGGPWDSRWNKPAYCMDRDGRIVATHTVPDSWFDGFADDAERRKWMHTPLPPVSDIPPPPLGWILNVWLPDWNECHPDDPVTEVHAAMIHRLYTRDPRLEWAYVDPQVQLARAKWEAEQTEKGLPLPVIKAPWMDNDERRKRERELERQREMERAATPLPKGPRSGR